MATSTINNPNIYTKVWTVDLDSVSGANGAYSHNTTVPKMTTDYKPILFECDDPSIFKDTVNISTGQNTVTLSCNNTIGSTTGVKASFVLQGDADTLSSAEYQALGSRIGDLNNLTTTDKSSVVSAVNSLNSNLNPMFLDISKERTIQDDGAPLTAPYDGFFIGVLVGQAPNSSPILLDGVRVSAWDTSGSNGVAVACGFIKKGQTISGGGRKILIQCCF